MKTLVFAFFLLIATCQADGDWSFKKRCIGEGGTYTPRSDPSDPNPVTERCNVKLRVAESGPGNAQEICEAYFPFKILSSSGSSETGTSTCEAESTLVCKEKWIQIYGRCYFLRVGVVKYKEAKKFCKKMGSTIAQLGHRLLPYHWRHIDTRRSNIWVDGGPEHREGLLHNEGDDLMLYFYRTLPLQVISVDGTIERAHTMCEYTPNADSHYRRFSRELVNA